MKHAVWIAVLMLSGLAAVEAQQSGKAVVPAGGASTANYVWVAANAGNLVAVRNTNGTAVTTLSGAPFNFNAPYDIVGSSMHHRIYVSNQGSGVVTVIDSDTLQFVANVTLPTCTTARGMSLSEDQSQVYIAGAIAAGPAVWELDTVTLATGPGPVGAIPDVTRVAEDCVVIRAANVGGSGNGPGKVFFSVRTSVPAGYIGVINLITGTPPTSIQTAVAGPLVSVNLPDLMERTPDHRFVFVGCSKVVGSGNDTRIIRIDSLTEAATVQIVDNGVQDLANNRSFDVTWSVDSGGVNRGFVLVQQDNGTPQIVEIFDTGAPRPVAQVLATQGALTGPITVRYAPLTQQLFVGDIVGTGNGYAAHDAIPAPVVFQNAPIGVGGRCQSFAVMTTPAIVITDICPRAQLANAASNLVTVHGAGFLPTATYGVGAAAVPITAFIDSNTIIVNLGGGAAATLGLQVNNPNFQVGNIDLFFRRYTPEQRPAFTIGLPAASAGYRMLSFPQYATLTNFKAALASALGPYNPVLYRVFFYRAGAYVELNSLADDGCDLAGESFWVITRNGATLTLTEPDVRANDGGSDRVIPINPGFNMISMPTLNGLAPSGSINWANVLVTSNPANFASAVPVTGGTIVTNAALEYVGGGYVTADPLVAGRGYWVENITAGPAYLVFPRGAVFKPSGSAQAAGGPVPAGMTPPPPPSGMSSGSSGGSGGGCGLLGLEGLLAAAFLRLGRRRRLAA